MIADSIARHDSTAQTAQHDSMTARQHGSTARQHEACHHDDAGMEHGPVECSLVGL